MPDNLVINGHSVAPGEQALIFLQVAKLPSNTLIDIPVHVYRAAEAGPVLLLLAGLHGDETNGVEIIRRMMVDKTISPEKGTVIAVPILNVYGFINYSRQVPDGKDVNRSFPGNPKGSLASRVAYLFMQEIFPYIDYGIDFHTGGGYRDNYPQIRCILDNPVDVMLAGAFAPPVILHAKLRDKSLRKEANKRGKSIIVYEGGESLRMDEFSIRHAIKGTQRVMHHLGMSGRSEPREKSLILGKSSWVRARHSGLFRSTVKRGEKVGNKEVIGLITDPYGEFELKVMASHAGIIIGLNKAGVVSQGDALFHIGIAHTD